MIHRIETKFQHGDELQLIGQRDIPAASRPKLRVEITRIHTDPKGPEILYYCRVLLPIAAWGRADYVHGNKTMTGLEIFDEAELMLWEPEPITEGET